MGAHEHVTHSTSLSSSGGRRKAGNGSDSCPPAKRRCRDTQDIGHGHEAVGTRLAEPGFLRSPRPSWRELRRRIHVAGCFAIWSFAATAMRPGDSGARHRPAPQSRGANRRASRSGPTPSPGATSKATRADSFFQSRAATAAKDLSTGFVQKPVDKRPVRGAHRHAPLAPFPMSKKAATGAEARRRRPSVSASRDDGLSGRPFAQ